MDPAKLAAIARNQKKRASMNKTEREAAEARAKELAPVTTTNDKGNAVQRRKHEDSWWDKFRGTAKK